MELDGMVEIRKGISSQGEIIASNGAGFKRQTGLQSLSQPAEGYTSNTGLYIRLVKRYNASELRFIYGAFTLIQNSSTNLHSHSSSCTLPGNEGFQCKSPIGHVYWCIDKSNICDSIAHCPDSSDEKDYTCKLHNRTHGGRPSITATRLFTEDCNNTTEKYCASSSTCARTDTRCPSEPCPEVTQLKCDQGHTCYSPSDICDGYPLCSDDTDEDSCNNVGILGSPMLLSMWVILTLVVLVLFAGTLYFLYVKHRRFSPVTSIEDAAERTPVHETTNIDL